MHPSLRRIMTGRFAGGERFSSFWKQSLDHTPPAFHEKLATLPADLMYRQIRRSVEAEGKQKTQL